MSVDKEASAFLRNFIQIRDQRERIESRPGSEIIPHIVTHEEIQNVILSRETEPRFFAGVIRGSGRPVWVSDITKAQPVSSERVHLYEEKLGTELYPLWPYA